MTTTDDHSAHLAARSGRELQLARAILGVRRSGDEGEAVTRLAAHCVQLLGVDAAGVFLLDHDRVLLATSTDPAAATMENMEVRAGDGPGVACCRSGAPVWADDLADTAALQRRWPRWAPAVGTRSPFRTVYALPLRRAGRPIGGVEVLRRHPGPLGVTDVALGQALADIATATVVALRSLCGVQERSARLQAALDNRVIIEQAKGVLAQRARLSVDTAFDLMRRYARSNNLSIRDVARDIVEGQDAGLPQRIVTRVGSTRAKPARGKGRAAGHRARPR